MRNNLILHKYFFDIHYHVKRVTAQIIECIIVTLNG